MFEDQRRSKNVRKRGLNAKIGFVHIPKYQKNIILKELMGEDVPSRKLGPRKTRKKQQLEE